MIKTFKYRVYTNKETITKVENWLELCRNLYNCCLEQRISVYKHTRKTLSYYDQTYQLPELKLICPEYKIVGSQVLYEVIDRLNKAYMAFFRRIKNDEKVGFPRFKSKDRYNSFTLTQAGWKLEGKYLSIHNLGRFKLHLSRPIQGDIKTITIRKSTTNKWYVCFSCDNVPERKLSHSDNVVGLDVGIKSFLVDSENNKIESPKYFRKSEKQLRRRQRRLSRSIKGSNRRKGDKLLVAKAHEIVKNQRNDFLHKLSTEYVKNYGTLIFEDLNINGMVQNKHLSKSILDSGWGEFIGLCEYKAEEAGRNVIRIPRFEPTSKTCSECGAINQELKLSDRMWVCKSCGTLHDRDFNAAKNILRVGLTIQAQTKQNTVSVV